MNISALCVKRPVFSIVISLLIFLVGIIGYSQLQWRLYPDIFRPVLSINTYLLGAGPKQIEESVTYPLENALQDIPNVQSTESFSSLNQSQIVLRFNTISREDFLLAQSQVLQVVSNVSLPDSASPPNIRMGGSRDNQLMFIGISDPQRSFPQLVDYADNEIKRQLQTVPGVGAVAVWSYTPTLRIELNPDQLSKWQLSATEVLNALEMNHLSISTGQLISQNSSMPVNANLMLRNLKEFEDLAIDNVGGHLVLLGELAKLSIGPRGILAAASLINNQPGVVISVGYTDDANPISVGTLLNEKLTALQKTSSASLKLTNLIDFSQTLKNSLHEVVFTIFEAVALVILVIFLTLGSFRATLIPAATIPICLVSTFGMMFALGYSINVMTLLAFVLAVGLVVDDAIVVLENTYRYLESGINRVEAAIKSVREISFVVIVMTLCLVSVYWPIAFLRGRYTNYFREFSFSLSAAILISGVVALTLTPMMCAHLLVPKKPTSQTRTTPFFTRLRAAYERGLCRALRMKWWVVGIFFGLLAVGIWSFKTLSTELMPKSNAGVVAMFLTGPKLATPNYMQEESKAFNASLLKQKEISEVISFFNEGSGNINYSMAVLKNLKHSDVVASQIDQQIKKIPGVSGGAFALDLNNNNSLFSEGSLQFYLTGMADYDHLIAMGRSFADELNKLPGVRSATISEGAGVPGYNIDVHRALAAELQVPLSVITSTLEILLGGHELTQGFIFEGKTYPVILRLGKEWLSDFSSLDHVLVKNSAEKSLPIRQFLSINPTVSPSSRDHLNGASALNMSLTIESELGYTTGGVIEAISNLGKNFLPPNFQIQYSHHVQQMTENNGSLTWMFVSGVLFVYLVLAGLFESFLDPLIVLLTVPVSIAGALLSLLVFGGTLNMFTGIGLITLVGLITKHGVLITRFANQNLQAGKSVESAIVEAASLRLRPILMTTLTMVLGAVPLLFSSGSDASSRFQIAIVLISGLSIGTLFALYIVPVSYVMFKKIGRI